MTRFRELSTIWKMILLNSLIMLIWWFAFNPGFYSTDSFGIIEMARSKTLTSESTAIWAIFVKLLSINGTHPEIATLFFSQLLGFSVAVFARTLFTNRLVIWNAAILSITPLVGAMGITLWHDIPMTSGFLLAVAGYARMNGGKKYSKILLLIGICLASFRYNGVPTLLITFFALLFISKGQKKQIAVALAMTATVLAASTLLNLKFTGPNPVQSVGYIDWMKYDLSCYAAKSNDEVFFERVFENRFSSQDWTSKSACTWFNDSKAYRQDSSFINQKTALAWFELLKKEPSFIFQMHLKRHLYLNPIPIFGLPKVPFIHTTIEIPGKDIEFWHPSVSEKLRVYPRIWNYFNYLFGFAGFWLVVIFVCAWWRKNSIYWFIGLLGLSLNTSLFIFAAIADARFSLFVLIAGQLLTLQIFLESTVSRWRRYKKVEFTEMIS